MGDISRTLAVDVPNAVRRYWATPAWPRRLLVLAGQAALYACLLTTAVTGVGAWVFIAYVHSAAPEMDRVWANIVTGLILVTPEQVNALGVLALALLKSWLCWSFVLFAGIGALVKPLAYARRTAPAL